MSSGWRSWDLRPSTTRSPARAGGARERAGAIGEIKALAGRQLAEQGPGAVSLRAIAREMGTASSALYRYFPSQGDLVTALCVEAYDSLAGALTAARDARPPGDHAGRWAAVCRAYRRWSLENPSDFALIFGTPLPGYHAPDAVTAAAALAPAPPDARPVAGGGPRPAPPRGPWAGGRGGARRRPRGAGRGSRRGRDGPVTIGRRPGLGPALASGGSRCRLAAQTVSRR